MPNRNQAGLLQFGTWVSLHIVQVLVYVRFVKRYVGCSARNAPIEAETRIDIPPGILFGFCGFKLKVILFQT